MGRNKDQHKKDESYIMDDEEGNIFGKEVVCWKRGGTHPSLRNPQMMQKFIDCPLNVHPV